jgi:hypothetical protein
MKIGVVTTTINIPTVLKQYHEDAHGVVDYVRFFVAGDKTTPPRVLDFCKENAFTYLTPSDQNIWRSSHIIGWNTDSRRNFAILAALQWGAEIIITVDDDMIPLTGPFLEWGFLFDGLWSGLEFSAPGYWFDHGKFTIPPAPARGLPLGYHQHKPSAGLVTQVTIGAAQGIILGVPDTDAVTTIASSPEITGASDIMKQGFVVSPQTRAVFNSQFTAFRRELAPAAAQFYGEQGRNTDIFASVLMRHECQIRGWYTYYGPPIGYHARQWRPPLKDLRSELWGVECIDAFAKELDIYPLSPIDAAVKRSLVLSGKTKEFYALWFEDCAGAMK